MTSLCFISLRIRNFKSIDDLTVNLTRTPGCYAIKGRNEVNPRLGSNGAGKSSIWDALTFALYGKTPRLLRSFDLIPWHSPTANPQVTLHLWIGETKHEIIRSANPHKLKLDGKVTTQERIDDLIRLPFDLFLHTVVFAQAKPLFLDLPPRDKLSLISDAINLNRFDTYSKTAEAEVKRIDLEIAIIDANKQALLSRMEDLREDIRRWTDLTKGFDANRKAQVANHTTVLNDLKDRLKKAEDERVTASIAADKAHRERQQCDTDVMQANADMQAAARAEGEKRMAEQQMEILKKGTCSVCGQKIDKAHRDIHLVRLANTIADLPDMATIRERASKVQDYARIAAKVDSEAEAASYRANYVAATLTADHTKAKAQLQLLMAQVNPHEDQVKNLGARLAQAEHAFIEGNAKRDELGAQATQYAYWQQAFKDMRLTLLDEFMQTLTVITNNVVAELGLDANVEFSVERESKSGTVIKGINCNIGNGRFEGLSGGEGQRLRLASALAFSQVILEHLSLEVCHVIFDEPSQHLSPGGLRELTTYLTAHANASGKVLFIADQRPLSDVTGGMTVVRKSTATSMEA